MVVKGIGEDIFNGNCTVVNTVYRIKTGDRSYHGGMEDPESRTSWIPRPAIRDPPLYSSASRCRRRVPSHLVKRADPRL